MGGWGDWLIASEACVRCECALEHLKVYGSRDVSGAERLEVRSSPLGVEKEERFGLEMVD